MPFYTSQVWLLAPSCIVASPAWGDEQRPSHIGEWARYLRGNDASGDGFNRSRRKISQYYY